MQDYLRSDWIDDQLDLEFQLPSFPLNQLIMVQSQPYLVSQSGFDELRWPQQKNQFVNTQSINDQIMDNSESISVKHKVNEKTVGRKIRKNQKQSKTRTGCNCKKSSCLKSYCQCYSGNGYCVEGCSCVNCKNNVDNKEIVEQLRNKMKLRQNKGTLQCQCKKSKCHKKYCECFNAGVSCGVYCKCLGCQNCQNTSEGSKNSTAQNEASYKLESKQPENK